MSVLVALEVTSGSEITLREDESLLRSMERSCFMLPKIGCKGGGCGLCKVQVLSGEYELGKMSKKHVSELDKLNGKVLACRCYPKSDLTFNVNTTNR
ncbi:2Fe-2S iron-sulfur cluster-binding protein [Marinobacter zhejiangensis]|uniref:Ferredoxin n=1 Tax=Marinobacter zhejiangensis TaxID=488535 RepID=A0A1I4PH91_9GAMM|nr:2Fe-2S iron-sulfur cluster-binding protein [Marinobacter zhejiangensis]SFM27027.1 Ferredoxin [Marinobacter zhejiangensis]